MNLSILCRTCSLCQRWGAFCDLGIQISYCSHTCVSKLFPNTKTSLCPSAKSHQKVFQWLPIKNNSKHFLTRVFFKCTVNLRKWKADLTSDSEIAYCVMSNYIKNNQKITKFSFDIKDVCSEIFGKLIFAKLSDIVTFLTNI